MIVQRATATVLSAVPTIVWSAFNLIDTKDKRKEKRIEKTMAMMQAKKKMICTPAKVVQSHVPSAAVFMIWRKRIPVNPPKTIEPSRAMLIMPEHSENIPPKEPRIKPVPYIMRKN